MADRPRIVALGDSLTAGYGIGSPRAFPALLQLRMDAEGFAYEIVNAGASGDTTAGGVARVARVLQGDVRVLILALGINDGLRGIPVAHVSANLRRIVEVAQSKSIAVLLCAMEALPLHGWAYTTDFHNAYVSLAAQYKLPVVPFFMMNVVGQPSLLLADRIHPNAAGAQVIADNVWPHLRPLLPRLAHAS